MKTGVYVHFPFCRAKCDYCDFFSVPAASGRESRISEYVDAFLKETRCHQENLSACQVDSIYFGGGTPSMMSSSDIAKIIEEIQTQSMGVDVNAEITLECNPSDMNPEYINQCIQAGVNRITLGLQTINPVHHRFIGRTGRCPDISVLRDFCSIQGIAHAIDIIAGIPGQDAEEFSDELHQVLDYSPGHLSLYMLTIEEGTPLYNRFCANGEWENHQRDVFETAIKILREYGYRHYEISNFAKPGMKSRHNMKYWQFDPYIGLGPASHSFFNGERWYNEKDVPAYVQSPCDVFIRDIRSGKDILVEYLMGAIRLLDGFYLEEIPAKTGATLPDQVYDSIMKLVNEKMLIIETDDRGSRVRLSYEGIFYLDDIVYRMVEALLDEGGEINP